MENSLPTAGGSFRVRPRSANWAHHSIVIAKRHRKDAFCTMILSSKLRKERGLSPVRQAQ